MKLSRFWSRMVIVCLSLGCVLMLSFPVSSNPNFILAGTAAMLLGYAIRLIKLPCPGCGYRAAPPQWSKSGTIHCPKCGKAFEFDK